jgi:hypothetical protein
MHIGICVNTQPARSRRIADALVSGAMYVGFKSTIFHSLDAALNFDLVCGYGWCNREIFEFYRGKGTNYIYIDLGYWNRKLYKSDYNGFHKCVLNARHPTKYFQRNRDERRITVEAPVIRPWRKSRHSSHIIVAGMSGKGASSVGYEPMAWERRIVGVLRGVTKRPIIYRPKPSWLGYSPIEGTTTSPDTQPIGDILLNAHALVTYYSNASIDALAYGVPIYTVEGPAKVASLKSLEQIEENSDSFMSIDRQQFMNDISYCHFTKDEIANGTMFRQFMKDKML